MATQVEVADFAGFHLQRRGQGAHRRASPWVCATGLWSKPHHHYAKSRVNKKLLHSDRILDTQSSENKLEQHAAWRLHPVRTEAIFALPYDGLSGLRPLVTGSCSPARAEPAPVC